MNDNLGQQHTEVNPEPAADQGEGKRKFYHFLVDVLETLVLSLLLFFGINTVSARIRVDGFSMEPTMHNGEFVLVNRLAYKFGEPALGDVIVFRLPTDPELEYIKRIIGLPGDTVVIRDSDVLVNGSLLSEPYIASAPRYDGSWVVPADYLYVLGDNRNNSSDSHSWGPVPVQNVIGKAVFVYWPFSELGMVEHVNPMEP